MSICSDYLESDTMPTPANTKDANSTPDTERRLRSARGPRAGDNDRAPTESLALLQALQSSLEPEVVVDTFARRLGEQFGVEGIAFDHPEYGRNWGAKSKHAFAARLKLDGTALGRLEFYRQRAFAPRERHELNELTGLLLHPLRNALTHACLQKQAFEDALTGLLNRQALARMLPRELAAAERQGQPLTLLMLDMDFLKPINDNLGHAAGDRALQDMAHAITGALRQSDLAFRIGGDEFIVVLPATEESGARTVVERIRQALADIARASRPRGKTAKQGLEVTFSAGIAASTPGITADALLDQADRAMYQAKHAGRNRNSTAAPQLVPPPAPDFAAERTAARMSRR
jgi:diguanylate cyclase (GGDEF)-like protein